MGWSRIDDGYMFHPKIVEAGPWAELLDRRGMEFCAKNDTDGLITRSDLRLIGRDIPKVASRVVTLLEVGRWLVNEGGGWLVHDYLKYNPSKAQREEQRERGRERQEKFRQSRNGVGNASKSMGRGGESFAQPKMIERCKKCDRLDIDCECAPGLTIVEGLAGA